MFLGFHESTNLIYEGFSTSVGIAPDPQPPCAQIGFAESIEKAKETLVGTRTYDFNYIFREDSSDFITRLRKGRIYKATETRPENWCLIPHKAQLHNKMQLTQHGQLQGQRLFTFKNFSLRHHLSSKRFQDQVVLIGTKEIFTKWIIVGIEPSHSGEEIVTLRAQNSNDVIPSINFNKIRKEDRSIVTEKYEKFLDVVYTSSVESIVDRACEACLAIILSKLRESNPDIKGLTLDKALEASTKDEKLSKRKILQTAADLLKLLHSRGKQSFQEQHNTRSLNYHDAQAAVECLSIVINELELAN
jgi:hypothetical protein